MVIVFLVLCVIFMFVLSLFLFNLFNRTDNKLNELVYQMDEMDLLDQHLIKMKEKRKK